MNHHPRPTPQNLTVRHSAPNSAPGSPPTAILDRTPQKIAPGRGITSKWAVLWPKWPCPKVPFPLRAKRARKAQNRHRNRTEQRWVCNFFAPRARFSMATVARCSAPRCSVYSHAARRPQAAPVEAPGRQSPPPLLEPLGESYWGVDGWRKVPCGLKYVVLRLKLTAIKRRNLSLWPKRGVVFCPK